MAPLGLGSRGEALARLQKKSLCDEEGISGCDTVHLAVGLEMSFPGVLWEGEVRR